MADPADDLFARVYADPSDDEARAVLADVLQERGDPRGLLIATQLTGRAPDLAREIARKNAVRLLGPLASVVLPETAVFDRGFLDGCGVHAEKAEQATRILGCVEWATVRTISLLTPKLGAWHVDPIPLIASPAMRSLRAVEYLHSDDIARIKQPLPLSRLRLTILRNVASLEHANKVFPDLVELHCGPTNFGYPAQHALVAAAPLLHRVKRLTLTEQYSGSAFLIAVHRRRDDFAAETIVLERGHGSGWSWTLSRGETGRLDRLEGALEGNPYHALEDLAEITTALSPELRTLHITATSLIGASLDAQNQALDAVRTVAGNANVTFDVLR